MDHASRREPGLSVAAVASRPDSPWGRFDDLRAGTARLFTDLDGVVVAERPEDVVPVLAAVDRASEAGKWAFGYVAYEASAGLDAGLAVHPPDTARMPLVWFGLGGPPREVPSLEVIPGGDYASAWWPDWTPEAHASAVAAAKERIAAGDTYQCNLTARLRGRVEGDLVAFYRDVALGQRGAYNAFLDLGPVVVASASPELFFQRRGDRLLARPMKGTAPRGRFLPEDQEEASALRASAKERAENIMIVDLMRNDLARVAEPGTVAVGRLLEVERYETVLQLTSDVVATLRRGCGLVDLFRALFPCGSVTGAPKASTMRLIRELEPTPRGVYCGAIGVVAPPSEPVRASFSVAIRTAVVDRASGEAVYGVGSGITWSSNAEAEHAEVLVKTSVLSRRHTDVDLLETMRYDGDGLREQTRHLRRLAESAAHLGYRYDETAVREHLRDRLRGVDAARVRLRLRRDGTVATDLALLPAADGEPVRLAVDDDPVDSREHWLFHKTTRREPYDRRRGRRPDVDDVVLVNERGEITEVTTGNLAVRLDECWWTPPLSSGLLPGIERARLLDLGILRERPLSVADLGRSQEVAVLNSLRGWRPARVVAAPVAPRNRVGSADVVCDRPGDDDGRGVEA